MTESAPRPAVGLVPAAGRGSRLGPLPFSKELLPVGFAPAADEQRTQPCAVCEAILRQLERAGVPVAYLVLGHGKWDIPAYLGDGSRFGLGLAYLVVDSPHPVATINAAKAAVGDAVVAFGFPDIVCEPPDALAQVLDAQRAGGADVVLGLFPADRPDKCDLVETDPDGTVRRVRIKPGTGAGWTWALAAWGARFTAFVDVFLARGDAAGEVHVGQAFTAAIDAGLAVSSVTFQDGWYVDVGTADDWLRTLRGMP